jgi:SAM-dependent methyltransferase
LEHLEEPEFALRECFRVIKNGGVVIYTVPFIWPLHEEPRDFYRFSKYGLEYLFKKVGFEIIEILPLCGFWGTFGQQLVYYLTRINRGPLRWFKVIEIVALVIQAASYVLDRVDRTLRSKAWASMYMVVAKKP